MFESSSQEMVRQYGALLYFLPFVPSLLAAGFALLIVRPGQRMNMLGLAAASIACCFCFSAALLPLLEAALPEPLLRWEAPVILCLPVVVTLVLAMRLRGNRYMAGVPVAA